MLANPEAIESDLYIFVDGPRQSNADDAEKVEEVKKYASSVSGFRNVVCRFSESNKGLGPSIINGVSDVISKYGKAIVVEDDLIVMPAFLKFVNQGLDKYQDDKNVWSVCGYSNKVNIPSNYPYDAYFCTRSSSWGWATWTDRWESVDWTFSRWEEWKTKKKEFNRWGGSDCFGMLNRCRIGENKSWAIRFCFSQFLQDKVSLFPIKSLVVNDGFDGEGSNCKRWSRFRYELFTGNNTKFAFPTGTEIEKKLFASAMRYHSLPARIYSRIMYLFTNIRSVR